MAFILANIRAGWIHAGHGILPSQALSCSGYTGIISACRHCGKHPEFGHKRTVANAKITLQYSGRKKVHPAVTFPFFDAYLLKNIAMKKNISLFALIFFCAVFAQEPAILTTQMPVPATWADHFMPLTYRMGSNYSWLLAQQISWRSVWPTSRMTINSKPKWLMACLKSITSGIR